MRRGMGALVCGAGRAGAPSGAPPIRRVVPTLELGPPQPPLTRAPIPLRGGVWRLLGCTRSRRGVLGSRRARLGSTDRDWARRVVMDARRAQRGPHRAHSSHVEPSPRSSAHRAQTESHGEPSRALRRARRTRRAPLALTRTNRTPPWRGTGALGSGGGGGPISSVETTRRNGGGTRGSASATGPADQGARPPPLDHATLRTKS